MRTCGNAALRAPLFRPEIGRLAMAEDDESKDGPLSSEALARDEWRGGAPNVKERDAPAHTLPASERDSTAGEEGGRTGAVTGTVLPPD